MPVNIATGTTSLEFYDIELPGRVPMRWTARYGSDIVDRAHSPIGRGWFGLAFCTLQRVEGGYLHTTANGTHVRFDDPQDSVVGGDVVRNLGAYRELFSDGKRCIVRSWDVETGDIRHLCFDGSGHSTEELRLTAVENVSGDGIDLIWQPSPSGPKLVAMRQRVERRELRIGYDRTGWIERIDLRTSEGTELRLATYEHDAAGQLIRIADAADFADRFEYDTRGRVTREIIKDGGVFHYRYDDQDRCVLHTGLSHYNERRLRFIPSVWITEVTDSYGGVTTYQHLPTGQLSMEVDPLGGRRTTQYDEHGRTLARTDANGATTSYAYDEMGNRSLITNALGHSTQVRFNAQHQPLELTDAAGQVWRRAYDRRGRLLGAMDPLGARWLYDYDASGNVAVVRNPLGAERHLAYEGGVLRSMTDWVGHATFFQFDALGRVTERRGPLGETSQLRYDAVGNLIQVRLPDGSSMVATYDHAGNMTRYIDAAGRTTRWRYGPCARLLERTDPVGGSLRYVWGTEAGRLDQLINEKGEMYGFERDDAGRIVAETSFDGARREFEYDAEGKTTAFINANGETVAITRDALGQVLGQSLPDGEELRFGFDSIGNLIEAVSADIAVRFERDAMGRVVREVQGERWVSNCYDAAGGLLGTQTSAGLAANYRLDTNGRPIALGVGDAVLAFERDANGREIGRVLGGGARLEQRYDKMGRLVEQRLRVPGADLYVPQTNEPVRRSYSYNTTGCLMRIDDGRWGTVGYAYDPAERLIGALRSHGPTERFEHDAAGNLTRIQTEGQRSRDEKLVYGPGNRLVQQGNTRYEYDAEGRRIRKIEAADEGAPDIWLYEWNALNRLKAITRPDGNVWRYRYDALARRVGKVQAGQSSCDYLWDREHIVQDFESDVPKRTWLWEVNSFALVATVHYGKLLNIVNDHLGTPRELVNEFGDVVYAAALTGWGNLIDDTFQWSAARPICNIRFPGQWADEESGLSYNFFRYYDSNCGRYVSSDPIGVRGGFNEFKYVLNPNRFIDPLGLCGSPNIDPKDVAGKTPAEIHALAGAAGLIPKGPDPMGGKGAYVDPATGQQRILIHPIDPVSGPHSHVNNPAGERLDINGKVVPSESPAAHLPLG